MSDIKEFAKRFFKQDVKVKILFAAAVLVGIAAAVFADEKNGKSEEAVRQIKRPSYDGIAEEVTLSVFVEDEDKPIDISIQLEPRKYTYEQTQEMFELVYDRLLENMLGDNESFDNVTSNLKLEECCEDWPVTIQWYSSDYELIDSEGVVYNQEFEAGQSEAVELTVSIEYEEYKYEGIINLTVCAPLMSEEELLKRSIESQLSKQAQDSEEEYISLPPELDGKKLTYAYKEDDSKGFAYILLAAAAVTALFAGRKQEQKKQYEHRKKQLEYDYSEVISKLMFLVGGGMTIRLAWEKIVVDYRAARGKKESRRYVYEEMSESLNELNAGVSEILVYQNFGRRCDTKEYLKFSSLIVQNITKGTKDLSQMLELEAIDAFEGRKNLAKKYGEEAGTKLLFPMIMMLGIVMVIIMVPAMMSF